MRLPIRERPARAPGRSGVVRRDRSTRRLMPRLRPGDVAVIDHRDLDSETAAALLATGVVAVVNARPMISGRYPNRGPAVLADAGVLVIDRVGEAGFDSLAEGRRVRLHDGQVYDGELRLTGGREVTAETVRAEIDQARSGLVTQVEALTHGSTTLLRREEDLLLHGVGLPRLETSVEDRTIVVVTDADRSAAELRGMRDFVADQRPVVVAVGGGLAIARAAGLDPAVVVLGSDPDEVPDRTALGDASDVVVVAGDRPVEPVVAALRRLGARPARLDTRLSTVDAALLVVASAGPRLVVVTGQSASLEDLLERHRHAPASSYLTRLVVGPRLLDAAVVPLLPSGRVRRRQLVLVLVVCLLVVALAVALTPLGQHWLGELVDRIAAGVG